MPKRRDAFLAASQALCYLHEEIDKLGYSDLVYTTGEVVCHPCVHTCVPDFFDFSFDARHEDPKVLEKVLEIVRSCAEKTWAGCTCEAVKAWNRDTVYYDKKLVSYVQGCPRGDRHQASVYPLRRWSRRSVLRLHDTHNDGVRSEQGRPLSLREGVQLRGALHRGRYRNAQRSPQGGSGLISGTAE